MQSSSGQIMTQGNVVSATATKLHSAEKEGGQIRSNVGSSNEFITTTAKYGGDRTSANSSNYETNEKQSLSDKLEVTVIPVDEEPYSKMITIPQSMIGKCNRHNLFLGQNFNLFRFQHTHLSIYFSVQIP